MVQETTPGLDGSMLCRNTFAFKVKDENVRNWDSTFSRSIDRHTKRFQFCQNEFSSCHGEVVDKFASSISWIRGCEAPAGSNYSEIQGGVIDIYLQ